jgi:hypothetical protein
VAYHQHERHQAAEHREQQLPAFAAETAGEPHKMRSWTLYDLSVEAVYL